MKEQDIIIASRNGKALVFCNGKVYGDYINKFSYVNDAGNVEIAYEAEELPLEGDSSLSGIRELLHEILRKYEPSFGQ